MPNLPLLQTGVTANTRFPLIVTTPSLVREDMECFRQLNYQVLVLDQGLGSDYYEDSFLQQQEPLNAEMRLLVTGGGGGAGTPNALHDLPLLLGNSHAGGEGGAILPVYCCLSTLHWSRGLTRRCCHTGGAHMTAGPSCQPGSICTVRGASQHLA